MCLKGAELWAPGYVEFSEDERKRIADFKIPGDETPEGLWQYLGKPGHAAKRREWLYWHYKQLAELERL